MSAYQVIKIIVAVGIVAGGADLLMDCRVFYETISPLVTDSSFHLILPMIK